MDLHIFYLNFFGHPTFNKYQNEFYAFLDNLERFLERYAKERYGIDLVAESYWPNYKPKSFDELREFDRKTLEYFQDDLQLYICYDLNIDHPAIGNVAGYCHVTERGVVIMPEDFMYAEMSPYTGPSLVLKNMYDFYTGGSRIITHELDHRFLAFNEQGDFVNNVHRAALAPFIRWDVTPAVHFTSQQDPRTF